jgi:hypothetical protein
MAEFTLVEIEVECWETRIADVERTGGSKVLSPHEFPTLVSKLKSKTAKTIPLAYGNDLGTCRSNSHHS